MQMEEIPSALFEVHGEVQDILDFYSPGGVDFPSKSVAEWREVENHLRKAMSKAARLSLSPNNPLRRRIDAILGSNTGMCNRGDSAGHDAS